MFDLGWSEMGVIAAVALIVLGPKELPNALRTVTQLMKSARKLASEFQSGVNEIVRAADLEDARQLAKGISKGSIAKAIEKVVDPAGEVKKAIGAAEIAAKTVPSQPFVKAPEIAPPALETVSPVQTSVPDPATDAAVELPAATIGQQP